MTAQTFLWPRTHSAMSLPMNRVHVYAWDLEIPPLTADWEILSEEETLRARRFVFPRDRDLYVRAHSAMRTLLAQHCEALPAEISFSSNAYGKPQIQPSHNVRPHAPEQLHFNLTHSGGMAVMAVSRTFALGVDLEIVRQIDKDVAEHHFSPRELSTLQQLPAEQWLSGFFRCWTSKEALLKGEGLGLNLPLDGFDVEVDPRRDPALLSTRPSIKIERQWKLVGLHPAHGAIGTLAILDTMGKVTANTVHCFSLNE